ncbi:MAG: aminotransferase class V-fold PLP-dependent enzyme, partial [Bacteroidota bacterium]
YSASSGTSNVATIIGLGEALSFLMSIGLDKIEEQVLKLSNYCRKKVSEIDGLEVISPSDDSVSSAIVSVRCQKANNRDLFQALRNENIIVKLLPKYNALRFSAHIFNTKEDIDKLTEKLEKLLS